MANAKDKIVTPPKDDRRVKPPVAQAPASVMDPNAPNAVKAQAAESKVNPAETRHTYTVLKTQMVEGVWHHPAEKGEEPVTVKMTETQARFRVLAGKLKKAS